tara:strand:+ start:57 stop:209 length:153 start_codon:yes stop_codon:yes gene_type:complete
MNKYFIEMKTSLRDSERYISFYIKAYNKEQIIDQLGDKYYLMTIRQTGGE